MTRYSQFCFLCLCLLFVSCKDNTPKPAALVGYPEEIEPIIAQSCAISSCHIGNDAPENLDLSSWNSLFQGSDFGAVLIPFNSQWSHVFQHLNTFEDLGIQATPRMPPAPDAPLSRASVMRIQAWIDAGAPNDKGERRWQSHELNSSDKVFALCAGSDLIAVADRERNLVMRFIEVGQEPDKIEAPHFIQLSPDEQFLYVTLIEGGFVEKYRTDNYAFVDRLAVGETPALIELSPDGSQMVISHWNSNEGTPKLSLVDTENMQLLDQLIGNGEFLANGHGMASTQDFSTLYVVANTGNYYSKFGLEGGRFVSEDKILLGPDVSPAAAQPSNRYKPYHCYLTEDDTEFYVSCNETDEIRVYHTANDSLIAQIPTGDFPRLMTFDQSANRLYVACANEENFTEQGSMRGCITVIDIAQKQRVDQWYRVGHRPHGLDVDEQRRRLYISSENTGGIDPPHHPTTGSEGPPGKYNVIDLRTGQVQRDMETEIPVFPNALILSSP